METLVHELLSMGGSIATHWLLVGIALLAIHVLFRGYFQRRKIQSTPWSRKIFVHEVIFSALTLGTSAATIGILWGTLRRGGWMTFAPDAPSWYAVALEFGIYFLAFDLYFYLAHRLMHLGPLYRLVHATHHRSTAPNPLTAFSFNPLEGVIAGAFLPLFLAAVEVHRASLAWIIPFGPLMSMTIHSGHELFPRWWYRSWLTKWFLTPMFHDQHHQLYHCNYGGFTTLWDRLFGTMNPTFEADYERHKAAVPGAPARPLPAPPLGEVVG